MVAKSNAEVQIAILLPLPLLLLLPQHYKFDPKDNNQYCYQKRACSRWKVNNNCTIELSFKQKKREVERNAL